MKKSLLFAVITAVIIFAGCRDEKKAIIPSNDEDNIVVDDEATDSSNDSEDFNDDNVPDELNDDQIIAKDEDHPNDEDVLPDENETGDDAVETDNDIDDEDVNDEDTVECIPQGGTVGVFPGAPECCAGLEKAVISHIKYENHWGSCDPLDGASVCINCGNSKCEKGENVCNCPEDCQEKRNNMCDDGSIDICDMIPPVDCEGSIILAIQKECWHCVDPLTCKETDRPAHCDDGTIPTCKMPMPECSKSEILAYQTNCYFCVNPKTCK